MQIKKKMALMGREKGRHFLFTVSVIYIQLEHQTWTVVYRDIPSGSTDPQKDGCIDQ